MHLHRERVARVDDLGEDRKELLSDRDRRAASAPSCARRSAMVLPASGPLRMWFSSQHSHDSPILAFGSAVFPKRLTKASPPQMAGVSLGSMAIGVDRVVAHAGSMFIRPPRLRRTSDMFKLAALVLLADDLT